MFVIINALCNKYTYSAKGYFILNIPKQRFLKRLGFFLQLTKSIISIKVSDEMLFINSYINTGAADHISADNYQFESFIELVCSTLTKYTG